MLISYVRLDHTLYLIKYSIHLVILYRIAKFKSTNIPAIAILSLIAEFNIFPAVQYYVYTSHHNNT